MSNNQGMQFQKRPRPSHDGTDKTTITERTRQMPLIGREQEKEILQQALLETERWWRTTRTVDTDTPWTTPARVPCMMLSGEAGIGKTRLAEEVSHEADQRNWMVIWSRGYAQEQTIPYKPWSDILRQAFKLSRGHVTIHTKMSPALARALLTLTPDLSEFLPYMHTMGSDIAGQEQLQFREAILHVLTKVSRYKPILIVIDDLHWTDRNSCELLSYLCEHLIDKPVLLVGTYREENLTPSHPLHPQLAMLLRNRMGINVHLRTLTDEQIATLVGPMPVQMIQYIQRQAAGNPFFAEALARTPEYQHILLSENSAINTEKQEGPLPLTIKILLEQRLEQLGPLCRDVLRSAAVLGRAFSFTTIQLMQNYGKKPVEEEDLLTAIEEALQASLLKEHADNAEITYHFWHPLLVQFLYENMSAARRLLFHRRAAQVLQQIYTQREEEGAAIIVHHLTKSDTNAEQIIYYAELAGHRAFKLVAYTEAAHYYGLAIEHLNIKRSAQHDAFLSHREHLARLHEHLGQCLRILGRFAEADDTYKQALDIHTLPEKQYSEHDQIKSAQIKAVLWCELGRTLYSRGRIEEAHHYYAQGEEILKAAGITNGIAWANLHLDRSFTYWRQGQYLHAQQEAYQAQNLFEEYYRLKNSDEKYTVPLRRILGGDRADIARTYHLLGINSICIGHLSEALDYLLKTYSIYEELGHQREMGAICCNTAEVYLRKAEYTRALDTLHRALQIIKNTDSAPDISYPLVNQGIIAGRRGDLEKAMVFIKKAISTIEIYSDPPSKSLFLTALGVFVAQQGNVSEARTMLCQALSIARKQPIAPHMGHILLMLGNMHLLEIHFLDKASQLTPEQQKTKNRLLKRTKYVLQQALTFDQIENETKVEAHIALAEAMLQSGDAEQAHQQALQARQEIDQFELAWLNPRLERLMGSILAKLGKLEQAYQHFEQGIQFAQKYEAKLENAYTQYNYGLVLLQHLAAHPELRRQGLHHLHEALETFTNCQALPDIEMAKHALALYGNGENLSS